MMVNIVLVIVLSLVVLGVMLVFAARRFVQDRSVPIVESLVPENVAKRAMAVFPHPDDEVAVGGTLCMLHRQGVETALLTLTRGEAVKTDGKYTVEEILRLRPEEVKRSAQVLGIGEFTQLEFPDGGLTNLPPARLQELKTAILAAVDRFQPSVILTFDERVGLYGHPDHTATARLVRELVEEHRGQPAFPIKLVYAITLPKPQIKLAIKFSKTFRERYPKDPGQALPAPQCAVKITPCGRCKTATTQAHVTQRKSLQELNPWCDKIPPWIYWRILDREYFVITSEGEGVSSSANETGGTGRSERRAT